MSFAVMKQILFTIAARRTVKKRSAVVRIIPLTRESTRASPRPVNAGGLGAPGPPR